MEILNGFIPEGIPTLPVFVQQLNDTLREDFFTAKDLEKIISQDTAISARILKIANSALFGLSGMVGTLSHAIVLLGTQFIRALAVSIPIIDSATYRKSGGPIQWESYWSHSFACACACSYLVQSGACNAVKEEAFVAGLIHDIGKPILWTYRGEDYKKVVKRVRDAKEELKDAEAAIVGIDHAKLGGELARIWHFPEKICTAISGHHDEIVYDQEALTLQVADYIANLAGFADFTRSKENLPPVSDELIDHVSSGSIEVLVQKLKEQSPEIEYLLTLL